MKGVPLTLTRVVLRRIRGERGRRRTNQSLCLWTKTHRLHHLTHPCPHLRHRHRLTTHSSPVWTSHRNSDSSSSNLHPSHRLPRHHHHPHRRAFRHHRRATPHPKLTSGTSLGNNASVFSEFSSPRLTPQGHSSKVLCLHHRLPPSMAATTAYPQMPTHFSNNSSNSARSSRVSSRSAHSRDSTTHPLPLPLLFLKHPLLHNRCILSHSHRQLCPLHPLQLPHLLPYRPRPLLCLHLPPRRN